MDSQIRNMEMCPKHQAEAEEAVRVSAIKRIIRHAEIIKDPADITGTELAALRALVAELERDAARLSFLANETAAIVDKQGGYWAVYAREYAYRGDTLREAIDKAMEAGAPG